MTKVQTGLDVLAADGFSSIAGKRVGVVANQAMRDSKGHHLIDRLAQNEDIKLVKLFAPEHGFEGKAQDMIPVDSSRDKKTGLEIISLYGDTPGSLKPSAQDMDGLDVLLVDLPDIGTRYYTYSQTMAYCMEAAGKSGVKVIVLDRPNPIGGIQVEGSPLRRSFHSFCGIGPIANRHGFTLGELAILFRKGFGAGEDAMEPIDCALEILQVQGWERSQYLDETGLPWFRPSPNMPDLETAIVYPGMCLFEATNLSEGRGTDRPFLQIGAPFIDPERWIREFDKLDLPSEGFQLGPTRFTPAFQKHAGQACQGLSVQVTDRNPLQPYRLGIGLLVSAARAFPEDFAWRQDAYEFISDVPAIDLLYGSPTLRQVAEGEEDLNTILEEMADFESWYRESRSDFLLY